MNDHKHESSIEWAFKRLATLQGVAIDPLSLNATLDSAHSEAIGQARIYQLCSQLRLAKPEKITKLEKVHLPFLILDRSQGWGVVSDLAIDEKWVIDFSHSQQEISINLNQEAICFSVQTRNSENEAIKASFEDRLQYSLRQYRGVMVDASLATVFIGLLAMATSLFSMQVYDRVIPTRSEQTLIVLGLGVVLSISLELAIKFSRSRLMDDVVTGLDERLSRDIFERLLQLRVDQIPASVGSLAAQIRGYEQVRSFYTASTLFALVDLPLGLLLLAVIVSIGHVSVALIVLVSAVIALFFGLLARKKLNALASEGAKYSNMKTGLLVEAVEGAETIKAGSGGWKFLARWIGVNSAGIRNDIAMRSISDSLSYVSGTLQQVSYAGLVMTGAWMVMQGKMTMGALIACSILSGRVLAPVLAIPGLILQHSHVKAAKEGLQRLYSLKTDYEGVDRPLNPGLIKGHFDLSGVRYFYHEGQLALDISELKINPGERIAVIGPIGSGKSTLLKLLVGLNHASDGRVLLDGLNISHISRPLLSRQIGYLQQEHRLFQGTLRENLLIGLADPGDGPIFEAMARTGMDSFVRSQPKGLEMVISEGGKGLSGGQRQLLAFTRLVLCQPSILLLDEPTASMDDAQEQRCMSVLMQEAHAGKTMIIVTHKPSVLPIVDRIIVLVGQKIVMDGPRDDVLFAIKNQNRSVNSAVVVDTSESNNTEVMENALA